MKFNGLLSATAIATAISFAAAPGVADAQQPTGHTGQHGAAAQQQNIGTVAQQRGFGEWARGVQGAGLADRLHQSPHTVFVADDAAYQQVPATQRQAWQTDQAAHRAALGHTIVEGRVTMADLRQRDHLTTIDGQRVPVRVEGDRVWVGDAQLREGDIAAGTGMIHQVDRVTWPGQQMQPGQQQPGQQMQPGQQQPGQQVQPGQQQPGQQVQPAPQVQPTPRQPAREPVRKGW